MKKSALFSVLLAALLAVATVTAQDDDASGVADSEDPGTTSDAANESEPDDVFIPTEEVQAAEELVFPVDI